MSVMSEARAAVMRACREWPRCQVHDRPLAIERVYVKGKGPTDFVDLLCEHEECKSEDTIVFDISPALRKVVAPGAVFENEAFTVIRPTSPAAPRNHLDLSIDRVNEHPGLLDGPSEPPADGQGVAP